MTTYSPEADGLPDPGEVVWTWVPFEEDYDQGKDRPVLVIGRDEPWLLALQASTVNDDEHRDRERQQGRYWVDIGSGDWDRQGRPSEVRVNRLIRVRPDDIRTEGTRVDQDIFTKVANEIRKHY